jgi:hypothetical protein
MKRNAVNSYLFGDGIKAITEFNEYFDNFVDKYEDDFYKKVDDNMYLPMMEVEISELKKNGTKCGDFLIDSLHKFSNYPNISIAELVVYDYSPENKLIKFYGNLGFKLTGKDMFDDEIEIPEELNYLKK